MPLSQGAYLETSTDLREGEIVYAGVTTDQLSCMNGSTTVILPFGRAVVFAAAASGMDSKCLVTLPSAAGTIRGISVATDTSERATGVTVDTNGNPGYPVQGSATAELASYATKGIIAVKANEAVVKGDTVTTRITAGANQGTFGKTTDASNIACPTNWEWATTTAANGIGLIYMR